jgi:hypothetical protein
LAGQLAGYSIFYTAVDLPGEENKNVGVKYFYKDKIFFHHDRTVQRAGHRIRLANLPRRF